MNFFFKYSFQPTAHIVKKCENFREIKNLLKKGGSKMSFFDAIQNS
jgi:hypothetical protein